MDGDLCSNVIIRNRDQCFIFLFILFKPSSSKRTPSPKGSMNRSLLWNPIILLYPQHIYLFMCVLQAHHNTQGPNAQQMTHMHIGIIHNKLVT